MLLPEYACASVLQPFRAERREIELFEVGEDLAVDPERLRVRIEEVKPAAVLAIDYFGFPLGGDLLAAAGLREAVSAVVDRSHGARLDAAAPDGGFAVTSLRKYLPLPDGALCAGAGIVQPPPGPGRLATANALGKALRHEHLARGGEGPLESAYLSLFARAERELDSGPEPEAMSVVSAALLGRLDLDAAVERRRDNYRYLLAAFKGEPRLEAVVQPLLPTLPKSVSPLAFPVRVRAGRDALRRELIRRRVFCPVHWPLPEGRRLRSDAARRLSATILSLPIDQRYEESDMSELVERLLAAADAVR